MWVDIDRHYLLELLNDDIHLILNHCRIDFIFIVEVVVNCTPYLARKYCYIVHSNVVLAFLSKQFTCDINK